MKQFGPSARELANGHWREILVSLGVDEDTLDGEHHSCPLCGGTDRFRFDDKEGRGTYYCNGCGAGDGFQFLMKHLGTSSFLEAARYVEGYFNGTAMPVEPVRRVATSDPKKERERIAHGLQKAWDTSQPFAQGDPVYRYLVDIRKLPIDGLLPCLHYHKGMGYFMKQAAADGKKVSKRMGTHPVMLAKATAPTGQPVGLHRTYLTPEGKKAPYEKVKKLMESLGLQGAAIRLYSVTGTSMGVAEGIETAIAAHALTGMPVWATISSTILESFEPPTGVTSVTIFADNDLPDSKGRRAGQEAAQKLKERLEAQGIRANIVLPAKAGSDFHDIWLAALTKKQQRRKAQTGQRNVA